MIVDGQGKTLGDAVVFAVPVSGKAPAKRATGIIDQVGKQFTPYVSIVQTGTAINFPNKDNIRHHVYSFSLAKTFDIKLYSGIPSAPVLFDKPGLVVLGCNIHDWMLAYLYVVDTPWFARSSEIGTAEIRDMPAGSYTLTAAHPLLAGEAPTQSLTVKHDGATKLTIKLHLTAAPAANPAGRR